MGCGSKKMARGGAVRRPGEGAKKMYAKGGKVKGTGMCKKGVKPCKMY